MERDNEYENMVERKLFDRALNEKIPIYGVLELTPLCNMNCDMCYVRLSKEEMNRLGKLRTLKQWLMLAKEMREAGVLFVLLTGGEPLLYPWFKELYLGLKELGMIVTINTNGTLIDEKWVDFFSQHKPRRINITLYGDSETYYDHLCHYRGGFTKCIQAIQSLKEAGVAVKINGSLTKANCTSQDGILKIGKELDVPVRIDTYMCPGIRERNKPFAFQSRMDPKTAAKSRINVLYQEMGSAVFKESCALEFSKIKETRENKEGITGLSCKAGKCSFTINWQGLMRPCVVMNEPSIDVFKTGFLESWKLLMEKCELLKGISECGNCKLRKVCNTCLAYAQLETGSYYLRPDYLCKYTGYSLAYMQKKLQEIDEK